MRYVSHSPEETAAFGRQVALALKAKDVIGLVGPLGAGKTQFVKGCVEGLGFSNAAVTSPTFALLQEYNDPSGKYAVNHIDLYRLESDDEVMNIGLDEVFESDGVSIVEWADQFPHLLPTRTKWWRFSLSEDPNERVIESWNPNRLVHDVHTNKVER